MNKLKMKKLLTASLWLLGLILLFNGIYLIVLHKFHIGTIIPLILGVAICFNLTFKNKIYIFLEQRPFIHKIYRMTIFTGVAWILSVLLFFIYLKQKIHTDSIQTPISAIIILGSGTEQGKPSAALKARLDTAAKLAIQQPNSIIVLSGGIDYGQVLSEAEIMANYLNTEYKVSKQRMILEKDSTSTELNLLNSKLLLREHNISLKQPIAITTSDFHTIRAAKIAKKVGYKNIYMLSASTPLNIRYNAWLREYFAFLSGWILHEY